MSAGPPARAPRGAWFLVLVAMLVSLACAETGDAGPLWADPGVVRLDPTHTRTEVEIHNRSGTVRPIGQFSLGGDDWDTLRFVDDTLPRTIPAQDSVVIDLELSRAAFRSAPGVYRSGDATLSFSSNQFAYEVPIEFVGTEVDRATPGAFGLALAGLAALVGLLAWGPLRRGPSTPGPSSLRAAVGAAFAALLLAAAATPLGLGLCRGRLGVPVGPRELAQCRDALGGAELMALPATPGLWWWLIALAIATAMLTLVRASLARSEDRGLALAGLRLLGFTLLLSALSSGLSPSDASTTALVLAQTGTTALGGLDLPRWGLVAQPLGFALALALVVATPSPRAHA
uniref:hypothetical protein n=1 Tax=Enhygromyxa salina TaxID=215803 RepID=UPI001C633C90